MHSGAKIAVVGSGISGLGAAWLLSQRYAVTLFEREPRPGGHSHTVDVGGMGNSGKGRQVAVDTGFIVYNEAAYPNLVALFEYLKVPTAESRMSFSVSLDGGAYEYSGTGLAGLFGQTSNIANPAHWRMTWDILRFHRQSRALLEGGGGGDQSLGAYLTAHRYSSAFTERHILPMAAAIWSTPSAQVMAFPVGSFVRFFANHGLLQAVNQPVWRTVVDGSRSYVQRVLEAAACRMALATPARAITRGSDGVVVSHDRGQERFDACVVATHAGEALALLADPDEDERRLLGAFRYQSNQAVLHRDARLMPRRRRLWSSWNYLGAGGDRTLSLSYWMNNLQPLGPDAGDIFVTLNPATPIDESKIHGRFAYAHPMFDGAAMAAQRQLWTLQGRRGTWFCGSYFGYGFHEDGLQAGLAAAEDIGGVRRPWNVPGQSDRIHVLSPGERPTVTRREAAE